MKTLLKIQSSIFSDGGQSTQLADRFVAAWREANPDGQVVVRDQMKVTLSVDHRALDGAVAARFLQDLKHLLEQPLAMLI